MLKVYGSFMCPDCVNAKKYLDENKIAYEFVDIFSSVPLMKEFIRMRDAGSEFDGAKEEGSLGIPALVEDDKITLDYEGYLKNLGIEVQSVRACSLDHKGGC